MPDFIDYAQSKAKEMAVDSLCKFSVEDISKSISESSYDVVIFGAVGDVLGSPVDTILKLKNTIKPNGFIIYDDAYLRDIQTSKVKFEYDYLTYEQCLKVFEETGVYLVDSLTPNFTEENDKNTRLISNRANELSIKYPDKKDLFNSYVQSQMNECDDLENSLVGITWLLKADNN